MRIVEIEGRKNDPQAGHDAHRGDGGHGGHGMGMMLVGCGVPVAAILLLPRLGVSTTLALVIGIVAMVGAHAAMILAPRFRRSRKVRAEKLLHAGDHQ